MCPRAPVGNAVYLNGQGQWNKERAQKYTTCAQQTGRTLRDNRENERKAVGTRAKDFGFQGGPSISSTFQAFANPSKRVTTWKRMMKFNISTLKLKMRSEVLARHVVSICLTLQSL